MQSMNILNLSVHVHFYEKSFFSRNRTSFFYIDNVTFRNTYRKNF